MREGKDGALGSAQKALFAVACIVAGFLPLSAGYVPGDATRLVYGVAVTALMLAVALLMRRSAKARRYWEIPLAFFGMALFIFADRYEPHLLQTQVLHDAPTSTSALASDVWGTVVIELNELVLTVIAVAIVLWLAKGSVASIYLNRGRFGRSYLIGIIGFAAFYIVTFRALSHTSFIPVRGTIDFARYLSLTPALLLAVAANGFLEELMFRGLLMSKLNLAFGPILSTVVQAVIFASWHVGVSYAASVLIFIVAFVFPLGLLGGYLTRSARSIVPAAIFHAGADIPIYLGFLSSAS